MTTHSLSLSAARAVRSLAPALSLSVCVRARALHLPKNIPKNVSSCCRLLSRSSGLSEDAHLAGKAISAGMRSSLRASVTNFWIADLHTIVPSRRRCRSRHMSASKPCSAQLRLALANDAPSLVKFVSTPLVGHIELVAHKLLPLGWVPNYAPRHCHSERLFGASVLLFLFSDPLGLDCLLPSVRSQQATSNGSSVSTPTEP